MASPFRVVALVSAYNEADIIDQVVGDLIAQGVQVYFLDDGWTDDTRAIVEQHVGRGVLRVESSPHSEQFDWERILRRKAELACQLEADWFIHHDADEFREGPWPDLSLSDAIKRVDAHGFNAIDFESLDFWPTHDRFRAGDDVREAFPFYSNRAPYDKLQVRCWKKTNGPVELASTGGHDVTFAGRNVFPLRFILRHYPIRGQAHGERKVLAERRGRFRESELARGWHVQYDDAGPGRSFVKDPSTLTRYDADAVRISLALRHRGVESLEDAAAAARADAARLQTELDTRSRELTATAGALHVRTLARDALYLELEARTRDRDRLYLDLETRTRERDALYTEVEARTRQRDALYVELESRIRQRDALYVDLERRTRERDALYTGLEARTRERDALYLDREARTRERDALFLERNDRGRELDFVRRDLHARSAELSDTAERLAKADADIDGLEAQAATLSAEVNASAAMLGQTTSALRDRTADLAAHRAAIAESLAAIEQRDAEIARYRSVLDDALRRLAGFEKSLSWRLTAPARAILGLFRK